jgi:hypothetical protein
MLDVLQMQSKVRITVKVLTSLNTQKLVTFSNVQLSEVWRNIQQREATSNKNMRSCNISMQLAAINSTVGRGISILSYYESLPKQKSAIILTFEEQARLNVFKHSSLT